MRCRVESEEEGDERNNEIPRSVRPLVEKTREEKLSVLWLLKPDRCR